MQREKKYPSDLLDEQWRIIKRLLPKWSEFGREPICRRWVIDTILYVTRTGYQWRQMPHDFPIERQFTISSGPGGTTELGSGFTMRCE